MRSKEDSGAQSDNVGCSVRGKERFAWRKKNKLCRLSVEKFKVKQSGHGVAHYE